MADVRALLKAKREEARISHPLASYNTNGQLRCIACGPVKHASAWEGHLGSKAHRTNVARLREEERRREAERVRQEEQEEDERRRRLASGKRRQEEDDTEDADMEDVQQPESKRQRVDAGPGGDSFPADFFSDPSRAAPAPPSDDEDEQQPLPAALPTASAAPALDAEWERFQREVVNVPDHMETYDNATVMAEAQLVDTLEGLPSQNAEEEPMDDAAEQEEKRRQREVDERELIMDRLLEEERAQEEADMKVVVMKNKLEALKRKREAAKAAKTSKLPT
ncbi:unnamed protein product [Mycena citricolor]|uniref:Coiled-coil domain-containing protein 16 n=1 Tax=Mycena citricolor TaxID=2018698 RepID=A0AAD2HIT9_9AGAR|nr:unnamed protein product [Mycena citricolor]